MENVNINAKQEKELGYTLDTLITLFGEFDTGRKKYEYMWKVLDSLDRGTFWSTIGKNTIPAYAVKPDDNWINYVKTNYVNSTYVGSYRANIFPRAKKDSAVANSVNEFLDYTLSNLGLDEDQVAMGNNAALKNFGAIEIGWNSDIVNGREDMLINGDVETKVIDNLGIYLDPCISDFQKGRAVFLVEETPLIELENETLFSERIKEIKKQTKEDDTLNYGQDIARYINSSNSGGGKGKAKLTTCYYKHGKEIDKIWILNDKYILGHKNIKPCIFPIAILYCNKPVDDPYGTPTTRLILNNVITLNVLNAIDSTIVSSSMDRAKIISRKAGLPEETFAREGNNPNKLWVVDGDPANVVRYVDPPELPTDRHLTKQALELSIKRISGVDDQYTGRDTNSVQTTGGMDILNQRLTMSDNSRIVALQKYTKDIAKLVLSMYVEHSVDRECPRVNKDQTFGDIIAVPFEQLRKEHISFDFTCDVTPSLPRNMARMADVANQLMAQQMQYKYDPALISVTEWLQFQQFPQKYQILRRIQAEQMQDDVEDIRSEITNYAGLVDQGVRPEEAVNMLANERKIKKEQAVLGNTSDSGAQAGSVQASQQG